MIVKLWDKSEIIIGQEAAAKLEAELQKPAHDQMKFVRLNGELIAVSAIAAVRKGGIVESDVPRLAPRSTVQTPEQREAARAKLAEIKQEFFARRQKRGK